MYIIYSHLGVFRIMDRRRCWWGVQNETSEETTIKKRFSKENVLLYLFFMISYVHNIPFLLRIYDRQQQYIHKYLQIWTDKDKYSFIYICKSIN